MRVRAARLIEHDQPLRVEDVELGEPAAGEVVMDVAFAGVNPVDAYAAAGRVAPDGPLPRTLGGEGAGTVEGRRVVARGHGLGQRRDGLWAEKAVVPEAALVEVPDGVDLQVAAAMGIAGVTAWRCVHELAGVGPSERVLVLGASGGVGSMIVSLCHFAGATVLAQTGSEQKRSWVLGRGADEVVVADAQELGTALGDFRPTAVFDPLGGGFTGAAIEAMAERGTLVLFGTSADPTGEVPLRSLYRKAIRVLGYAGLIAPDEALASGLRHALEAVATGQLEVAVDTAMPLGAVNEAFARLAGRQVQGKLLLDPAR